MESGSQCTDPPDLSSHQQNYKQLQHETNMQAKTINLSDLHLNTGQIKDVPKTPRFIKDERYEALKKKHSR